MRYSKEKSSANITPISYKSVLLLQRYLEQQQLF